LIWINASRLRPLQHERRKKETTMHRILVPIDGSSSSDHAVQHAIALRRSGIDAEIQLLHVQPALLMPREVPDIAIAGLGERLDHDEVEHAVASAKRLLGEAGVPYSTRIVSGDPAQEIALHADMHDSSQIVMGTRGLGLVKSLVLGSVAMKVIHLVKVPVTLVK
jgi:nucleotide-binding universal stress UspA family protein